MFNGIMQVQSEYTLRVQKYKQPYDNAPDGRAMRSGTAAAQTNQRCWRRFRHSVGVWPDQRRKARVNALELA